MKQYSFEEVELLNSLCETLNSSSLNDFTSSLNELYETADDMTSKDLIVKVRDKISSLSEDAFSKFIKSYPLNHMLYY